MGNVASLLLCFHEEGARLLTVVLCGRLNFAFFMKVSEGAFALLGMEEERARKTKLWVTLALIYGL